MTTEIKNATIDAVALTSADHGLLSAWVYLDYGDCGHQGFGGWSLYLPKSFSHHTIESHAGHFIFRVMEVAGVEEWAKLKGRTVRAKIEDGLVVALGHITKNDWFEPKADFAKEKVA